MDTDSMSAQEIMELQKKNCIFCKIIAREIPSNEIYSDEKVSVILDINPANEGHCLVMPKSHYQILPQIPEDLIGYLFSIAKKTSRILLKSLGTKGTTIFVANGAIAGQKAPHFMIHVMTRKHGDMLFELPKMVSDEGKLLEIQSKLSARLGHVIKKEVPQIELKHDVKEEQLKKDGIIKKSPEHPAPNNSENHEIDEEAESGAKDGQDEQDNGIEGDGRTLDKEPETDKKDMNLDDIANLFLK